VRVFISVVVWEYIGNIVCGEWDVIVGLSVEVGSIVIISESVFVMLCVGLRKTIAPGV
jgi:hypothetical protein